jgi:hypothetical protein
MNFSMFRGDFRHEEIAQRGSTYLEDVSMLEENL